MKFGPVQTPEAIGGILAHSLNAGGVRIRKGKVLAAADIEKLAAAGHATVTVARLEPGDIGEDQAAKTIADAMVPEPAQVGLRLGAAATGRVNVYATGPGVLALDVSAIEAANQIDPMITIATLPDFSRTHARCMVATVKIISYGVTEAAVNDVANLLRGAMRVHPVVLKTATLIQTTIGTASVQKGEKAIAGRLSALGMTLCESVIVAHETDVLATAVAKASGDIVLILTGSATSDINDTAPMAVRVAGGQIARFGMPVDPGNLLFLGSLGDKPVIGLPGCARSPAPNGADWVLERVVCGLGVTNTAMAAMGVGGLLKDSPARGMRREQK